jgi:membrane associated rhomboid family serine protease
LPPVTQALLWINSGMFLLQLMVAGNAFNPLLLWPLGGESEFVNPIAAALGNFLPWQLVTYAFLHANLPHLFFNMLALLMFGAPLEYTWGTKRFLQFYFVCVVGAGLTYLGWAALIGSSVPVLGASGGIFGLLLAYGMLFPRQRIMPFPGIEIEARMMVIVFGAIELIYLVTGTAGGVAIFAHLGGMLFGWLMIRYWRGDPPFKRRRRRPPLKIVR